MEIYHLTMISKEKEWTITMTAKSFNVSNGLVSENLRLADASHRSEKIFKCESRADALKKLSNGRF